MARTKSFRELVAEVRDSPGFWERKAVLGFIHSVDRLLHEAGQTRADLARMAGMKESTVSRALSGKQNLTLATMNKIAEALDATVHIHVERRGVRGGWLPMEQMPVAASSGAAAAETRRGDPGARYPDAGHGALTETVCDG